TKYSTFLHHIFTFNTVGTKTIYLQKKTTGKDDNIDFNQIKNDSNHDNSLRFSVIRLQSFTGSSGSITPVSGNIWQTFTADTGSTSADTPTDSFALIGGNGIST